MKAIRFSESHMKKIRKVNALKEWKEKRERLGSRSKWHEKKDLEILNVDLQIINQREEILASKGKESENKYQL